MNSSTRPGATKPRRVLSIREIIVLTAVVAFAFIAIAGIALSLRVVPNATAMARRGASTRTDYLARAELTAALDSALTDQWALLRRARLAPIPSDTLAKRRANIERIARSTGLLAPLQRHERISLEFVSGLEEADEAASQLAAALLNALGAIELRDTVLAGALLSRADELDAPLTSALNDVTLSTLADLAREEVRLARDARAAALLIGLWLVVGLLAAPFLWRLLLRRLVQPLDAIDGALNRIEGGDLEVELTALNDDELGRLGAHFNRTTQMLRTQRAAGERAAALEALEASEARYRSAFEGAAVGLAETSLDGTVLRVNLATSALMGRPPEALVGHALLEFTHVEERERLRDSWPDRMLAGEDVLRDERRYLRPDGSVATAQVTATLMRDPDGTPRHVLAVLQDVTEQRRLERELLQAMKLEAVGQLAGGVAHDFNNILTGIIGYADLLEHDGAQSAAVRDDALAIRKAAMRGAELSRSLLTLARRNTPRAEPFAFTPVVQETVDLVRRTFDRRVEVHCTFETAPTVLGDRSLVASALLNLAVNARDAMPNGGTIAVTVRPVRPEAAFCRRHAIAPELSYVAVEMRDSGAGMSPEILAHVFEPFFTTKAPGKGTGLGLAMVYGTVKDHRGAITIESAVGDGTRVTLYLPCADDRIRATPTRGVPIQAQSPARLLIVDNDDLVREVAARMLVRLGYDVECAEHGIAAIERLDAGGPRIDLVLMDGNMPLLNGIETARRIHASHPSLPLIYASGHSDAAVNQDLEHIGFRGHLVKPYSLEALAQTVARCLDLDGAFRQSI